LKFILFAEGWTERRAVGPFLTRWLDARLATPVGVKVVRFDGWSEFDKEVPRRAHLYLEGRERDEIIAVVGLLDLAGPTFYPADRRSAEERRLWAIQRLEQAVGHPRFRMFFAVHEVEAWLLSQPAVLPAELRRELPTRRPETINFQEPPSRLLDRLYRSRLGRPYKKVTDGSNLFRKLDPEQARNECPALADMLDTLLALARDAGP